MERQRRGFILTNGSGCYIVSAREKNEIDELLRNGWRIAFIRPICTSMAIKLKYLPDSVVSQRVYSYSLCIMENRRVLLPRSETRELPANHRPTSMTRGSGAG